MSHCGPERGIRAARLLALASDVAGFWLVRDRTVVGLRWFCRWTVPNADRWFFRPFIGPQYVSGDLNVCQPQRMLEPADTY